jgi:hypothetical protein
VSVVRGYIYILFGYICLENKVMPQEPSFYLQAGRRYHRQNRIGLIFLHFVDRSWD